MTRRVVIVERHILRRSFVGRSRKRWKKGVASVMASSGDDRSTARYQEMLCGASCDREFERFEEFEHIDLKMKVEISLGI